MRALNTALAGFVEGDHLGERMRQAREHSGVELKAAASAIGLSDSHLRRIENGCVGMVSDPATLVRAAKTYGVSQVWLYAGAGGGARFVPDWYRVRT
jgi:transcriptional regulator with XRE-family HTH domain